MENKVDFSKVYITYYPKLLRFAKGYVIMEEDAENITQDVFTDVWEKWGFLMGYIKNSYACQKQVSGSLALHGQGKQICRS